MIDDEESVTEPVIKESEGADDSAEVVKAHFIVPEGVM